jgi:hypothetical protein
MKRAFVLPAGVLGCLVAAAAAQAAPMSSADYRGARDRIAAEYKAATAACDKLVDNAKDVCREQAKGREKVASAELEYNRSGQRKDATRLATVKADADFRVARERCDDRSGNDKEVCVAEAKTAHTKALADARMRQRVGEAREDAAEDKREADYQLARERCDALSGDAKAKCLADARARFGKG